jgi:hypothetical protein
MFSGACTIAIVVALPETRATVVLKKKASKLRQTTNDPRWYAPSYRPSILRDILFKPIHMMMADVVLTLVAVYISMVYGIMYLLFPAMPFVFVEGHGFNPAQLGCTFISLTLGATLSVIWCVSFPIPAINF